MIGQTVGNYRIVEKIGTGGMGEVFKGVDGLLEREVAIKSLRPQLAHRQDIVERFRAEAVALARLNHPNIVTLYSFFQHGNQFLMALEFVHGEGLDKLIDRYRAAPWREAITLACQALDGLEHAHKLGIIHRDIKPANMILTPAGTLKLMDFGIVRILEKARLTQTGRLVGTLEYMSPEQIQGLDTDARADIYALGAVLYEMLTGHVPFEKDSDYELIKSQVEQLPSPPRELMPQLPSTLEEVVLRALAKAPEDRFQNAAEFRCALQAILKVAPSSQETGRCYQVAPSTSCHIQDNPDVGPFEIVKERSPFWKHYPGIIVFLILAGISSLLISLANHQHEQLSLAPASLTMAHSDKALSAIEPAEPKPPRPAKKEQGMAIPTSEETKTSLAEQPPPVVTPLETGPIESIPPAVLAVPPAESLGKPIAKAVGTVKRKPPTRLAKHRRSGDSSTDSSGGWRIRK